MEMACENGRKNAILASTPFLWQRVSGPPILCWPPAMSRPMTLSLEAGCAGKTRDWRRIAMGIAKSVTFCFFLFSRSLCPQETNPHNIGRFICREMLWTFFSYSATCEHTLKKVIHLSCLLNVLLADSYSSQPLHCCLENMLCYSDVHSNCSDKVYEIQAIILGSFLT